MNGHLFTFAQIVVVAHQLMSHLLNRESTPEESASLAILRENQVLGLKSGCSANARRLLTKLGHVKRDAGLALSCVVNHIGLVHCHHGVVHFKKFCVSQLSVIAWVNDTTFFVHNTETFNLIEGTSEVHFSGELVFKQISVDLIHGTESAYGCLKHSRSFARLCEHS